VELLGMLIHEGHCGVNDRDHMGATPAHKGANVGLILPIDGLHPLIHFLSFSPFLTHTDAYTLQLLVMDTLSAYSGSSIMELMVNKSRYIDNHSNPSSIG
jgi:hypothetical protein